MLAVRTGLFELVNSSEALIAAVDNAGTEIHYEVTGESTPVV